MTRLLVSVRSLGEARLAAEAGVDLIDLKEPRHGSLGLVSAEVAQTISDAFASRLPLSMALGELRDYGDAEFHAGRQIPPGIVFAKLGLAQCASVPDWPTRWHTAIQSLPPTCQPVAVVYADWRQAASPRPESILDQAVANGCRALLIDTWGKTTGDLLVHLAFSEIEDLLQRAREHGLLTVLAGSLSMKNVAGALKLLPDYVAVRGAVCDGPRDGDLCASKVRKWVDLIAERRSNVAVPYQITITEIADAQLKALAARDRRALEAAILSRLQHEPMKPTKAIKRLRPNPLANFELRAGQLRALYNVKGNNVIVLIIGRKVGNKLIVEGEEFHGHQDNLVEPPGSGTDKNAD